MPLCVLECFAAIKINFCLYLLNKIKLASEKFIFILWHFTKRPGFSGTWVVVCFWTHEYLI